ncbi:MAG: tRNA pseudouridine(55) synthase TruB [Candidatus Eremiobacteraeota bacterium]|nr:tRNA pseudouridine(55) synthase TruB [Candidatus Eremiobacteraeota bacterium]
METPFGFINAFKPPGPSSAAFGNWLKRLCAGAAVGHWGTLDPTACGVLVLAVGKATKLLPLLPHSRKQYVFELVVGERTNSGDAQGVVVATAPVATNWALALQAGAESLIGPHLQVPPMHSAVKVDGRPLYRDARKGLDVPRAPRTTTIHNLRVIAHAGRTARLFVDCDAGTYVRVLCEELGRRLDLPARMGALLRVGAGPFVLRESVRPDQIAAQVTGCLIDPLSVLQCPRYEVDDMAANRFVHGNEVRISGQRRAVLAGSADAKTEVLVTHEGRLIGCGYLVTHDADPALIAPTRVLVDGASMPSQGPVAEEANE